MKDDEKISLIEESITVKDYSSIPTPRTIVSEENLDISDNKLVKWDFCISFQIKDEKYNDMGDDPKKR